MSRGLRNASRRSRLWRAVEERGIPLTMILLIIGLVVAVFLTGLLIYELRTVLLVIFLAGLVAVLLNPLVVVLQRRGLRRRGFAVTVVALWGASVFVLLAVAFAHPFVSAVNDLAAQLPVTAHQAEHGKGWLGQLATRYHLQAWVQVNAPKLAAYGRSLVRPILNLGHGTVSFVLSISSFFVLVLLFLSDAPKMRRGLLSIMSPERAYVSSRIGAALNTVFAEYMLGNLITSILGGIVTFITLLLLGVPFAFLWASWLIIVDLIPTVGGTLAAIPIVLFAISHSLTAGIVTLVVCAIYIEIELHILNPILVSKTMKVNGTFTFLAVLIGVSLGNLIEGPFGGFAAALLAVPTAGALQIVLTEIWRATTPAEPELSAQSRRRARLAAKRLSTTTRSTVAQRQRKPTPNQRRRAMVEHTDLLGQFAGPG